VGEVLPPGDALVEVAEQDGALLVDRARRELGEVLGHHTGDLLTRARVPGATFQVGLVGELGEELGQVHEAGSVG
jgi:hypothetical protein